MRTHIPILAPIIALCAQLTLISQSAADTPDSFAEAPSVEVAREYELELEKLSLPSLLDKSDRMIASYDKMRSEIGTEPARARLWSLRTQLVTKCVPANIAADQDVPSENTVEMLNGAEKNFERIEERCEEARRDLDNLIQSTERVSK